MCVLNVDSKPAIAAVASAAPPSPPAATAGGGARRRMGGSSMACRAWDSSRWMPESTCRSSTCSRRSTCISACEGITPRARPPLSTTAARHEVVQRERGGVLLVDVRRDAREVALHQCREGHVAAAMSRAMGTAPSRRPSPPSTSTSSTLAGFWRAGARARRTPSPRPRAQHLSDKVAGNRLVVLHAIRRRVASSRPPSASAVKAAPT